MRLSRFRRSVSVRTARSELPRRSFDSAVPVSRLGEDALRIFAKTCKFGCYQTTRSSLFIDGGHAVAISGRCRFLRTSKMSEHKATIHWRRATPDFQYETYSRDHDWDFDAGIQVRASAAPAYLGSPACVDPEEAFVASLSSCHMLTFLAIAARKKFSVDEYRDEAVGILATNAEGKLAITAVTLQPVVAFGGEKRPTVEEIARMHDQAHHACFIANSVKTEVTVKPN